jgi:hypothetical protein
MNREKFAKLRQESSVSSQEYYVAARRSSAAFQEIYSLCDQALNSVNGLDYPDACKVLAEALNSAMAKSLVAPHNLKSSGDFEFGKASAYEEILAEIPELDKNSKG